MPAEPAAAPPTSKKVPGLSREQRTAIPPFAAVRAFEALGAAGGIRRAAEALSVDHAAVSRHLRALEEWTGTALVDRSSGTGGQLTPQGRIYHQRVTAALAELAAATQDLRYRADDKRLRLWCVPGLASEWLSGRIGGFSTRYPGTDLELQPSDTSPDFDARQADAYLHYVIDGTGGEPDPKLRTTEVARPAIIAVASPAFLAATAPLRSIADLLASTLLHESNTDQWRRWFARHGLESSAEIAGPRFWQAHLTLAAARRGQGIALTNGVLVGEDLRVGRLVELGPFAPVHLGTYVFSARRDAWRLAPIANFRRWLQDTLKQAESVDRESTPPGR